MISIRAVVKAIVALMILAFFSGCGTPSSNGKLLVSQNSVTPVQSLKVVFVFPKPTSWKDAEGERVRKVLEANGYFDGGYEKWLAQKWQTNFAANGIKAEIVFADKPLSLNDSSSNEEYTHLLVLSAKAFYTSRGYLASVSTDTQLIDNRSRQSIWKSDLSLFVGKDDNYKKEHDLEFLKMMNSWVESGIVRLNTKTPITAEGKSKVTIMGILL